MAIAMSSGMPMERVPPQAVSDSAGAIGPSTGGTDANGNYLATMYAPARDDAWYLRNGMTADDLAMMKARGGDMAGLAGQAGAGISAKGGGIIYGDPNAKLGTDQYHALGADANGNMLNVVRTEYDTGGIFDQKPFWEFLAVAATAGAAAYAVGGDAALGSAGAAGSAEGAAGVSGAIAPSESIVGAEGGAAWGEMPILGDPAAYTAAEQASFDAAAAGTGVTDAELATAAGGVGATGAGGGLAGAGGGAGSGGIGSTLQSAGGQLLKSAGGSLLSSALGGGLAGAVGTGLGSAYQANNAGKAAATTAAGARDAAGVLAPAAIAAGKLQSDASLSSAGTLAAGATQGAAGQSAAALAGGRQVSDADLAAAGILSQANLNAAGQRVDAYGRAITTADDTLAEQRKIQQPYMDSGTDALKTLNTGLATGGQFNRQFTMADAQNMPAYQFALQQGQDAIRNASAAGGTQLSSNNIQNLGKFAEGTAAQYEQQAFTQWMAQNNLTLGALQNAIATGQVSATDIQQALAQHGVSVETLQNNIGAAQANGTMGAASATAEGMTSSAKALADSGNKAAGFTATGVSDASKASAAGTVGSAYYLANGLTGAANATASGITGAANADAAGTVAKGNIIGNGLSNIGNDISKAFSLGSILSPKTATTTANTSASVAGQPANNTGITSQIPMSVADISPSSTFDVNNDASSTIDSNPFAVTDDMALV